jgi:L-ribulose-5-phosphate 4-epimerase
MFEKLKQEVFEANLLLPEYGLITFTWGNVSQISEDRKYVAIKPSGVEYSTMTVDDIVVLTLDGEVVEGKLKPSSDTPTHLELYREFKDINAIVHTHSKWATTMAQAKYDVKPMGTTHADYFYGNIPCTNQLTNEQINGDYELETGKIIVETFKARNIEPKNMPAVLVGSHGPFTWGKNARKAVENSVVLEEVSHMAYMNYLLRGTDLEPMKSELLDKHFLRKHGANSYYGQ